VHLPRNHREIEIATGHPPCYQFLNPPAGIVTQLTQSRETARKMQDGAFQICEYQGSVSERIPFMRGK
jgi:hypothetical protein